MVSKRIVVGLGPYECRGAARQQRRHYWSAPQLERGDGSRFGWIGVCHCGICLYCRSN